MRSEQFNEHRRRKQRNGLRLWLLLDIQPRRCRISLRGVCRQTRFAIRTRREIRLDEQILHFVNARNQLGRSFGHACDNRNRAKGFGHGAIVFVHHIALPKAIQNDPRHMKPFAFEIRRRRRQRIQRPQSSIRDKKNRDIEHAHDIGEHDYAIIEAQGTRHAAAPFHNHVVMPSANPRKIALHHSRETGLPSMRAARWGDTADTYENETISS